MCIAVHVLLSMGTTRAYQGENTVSGSVFAMIIGVILIILGYVLMLKNASNALNSLGSTSFIDLFKRHLLAAMLIVVGFGVAIIGLILAIF